MHERSANFSEEANRIASIALSTYPDIDRLDQVIVNVAYGYDIGIAHAWIKSSFNNSPEQWRRMTAAGR